MKPDGSDQARLTHDGGNDGRPLWSPDGNQIIVDTDRGQPAEIYAMNPDGSGQTRLTHNVGQIGSIAWSLDGKQISFTSEGTGDDEIYVMNADGSNVTQLTYSPGQDTWSAWLPPAGTTSAAFDELSSGPASAPAGAAVAGAVLWIDNGDPEEGDLVKGLQQAQPEIEVTLQEDSHAGNDFNLDVAPLPSTVTVGTGPDFGKTLDQHDAADLTGIWEQSGLATAKLRWRSAPTATRAGIGSSTLCCGCTVHRCISMSLTATSPLATRAYGT